MVLANPITISSASNKSAVISGDMDAVTDSALILADDYAMALVEKPELASTRLNAFKRFYNGKSEAIRDTVCGIVYDFMVRYIEKGKEDRANAFRDCYLAVAPETDSRLGPFYATLLAISKENSDTIAIKEYIPLLEDYSRRMNVDYDEDLDVARALLLEMRNRRPIKEELTGVWVSDYITKNPLELFLGEKFTFSSAFKMMGGNIEMLDLYMTAFSMTVIAFEPVGSNGHITSLFHNKWVPIQASEMYKYGFEDQQSEVSSKIKNRKNDWVIDAQETLVDENSRWLYGFWGSEHFSTFDPEITANVRQSIQRTHASVVGQYSRSNYKFGDRLLANTMASGFSAIGNGLLDMLSVSKTKVWSKEFNAQQQHHNKLVGNTVTKKVVAKSNSEVADVKDVTFEMCYYRWEPKDNVFFIDSRGKLLPLLAPVKEVEKHMKDIVKAAKGYWKEHRKNGDDDYFFQWFNRMMLTKLQNKAGEGEILSPEIRSILEI